MDTTMNPTAAPAIDNPTRAYGMDSAADELSDANAYAVDDVDDVVKMIRESVAKDIAAKPKASGDSEMEIWSINLVYGELKPHALVSLLRQALDACGTVAAKSGGPLAYIDLGSGEGFPSIVAALAFPQTPWSRIDGIELIPRLHRLAEAHRDAAIARHLASADGALQLLALSKVRYYCGDMLAQQQLEDDSTASGRAGMSPWTEADIVFGEPSFVLLICATKHIIIHNSGTSYLRAPLTHSCSERDVL